MVEECCYRFASAPRHEMRLGAVLDLDDSGTLQRPHTGSARFPVEA